ncbi:GlxA family transcriptional regulator [Paraburkholderia domus]|uniref:GlxA family transcriptional regulator n=1 Tax=Paraburkholderia domus TaxID=2793075 RepID=UPI0022A8A473|nr:GlxA family transcriptional regulator [Paraburkholderia domus]
MGFLLMPDFSMMELSSATDPLRVANRLVGKPLYSCHLVSATGEAVLSSSGFALQPEFALSSSANFDMLFVVTSVDVDDCRDEAVFGFLRDHVAKGRPLGALGLGAIILARAGLLDGRRCTTSWNALKTLAEEFPSAEVTSDLYCADADRFTCGEDAAAITLMLDLIARDHDRALAADVAEQFLLTRKLGRTSREKVALPGRYGIADNRIVHAITLMEEHIERPMPLRTIAFHVGISPRQLERVWLKNFHTGPSQFYLELRLKAAQKLLHESTRSLLDIASHCGFASVSHFGRSYRRRFLVTPGQDRSAMRLGGAAEV